MSHISQTKSARQRFLWKTRIKSLGFAFEGLRSFIKKEHNAWIHLIATIAVVIMAIVLKINAIEAIALTFSIGFVWASELFNTAIERTMDFVSKERNLQIKVIKDLAAAAVLISAIAALIIGCIVFIPKLGI